LTQLALQVEASLEGLNDVQNDAQTQPRASRSGRRVTPCIAAKKPISNLLLIGFRDSNPGIFDLQSAKTPFGVIG
jgi:hypothetical protein